MIKTSGKKPSFRRFYAHYFHSKTIFICRGVKWTDNTWRLNHRKQEKTMEFRWMLCLVCRLMAMEKDILTWQSSRKTISSVFYKLIRKLRNWQWNLPVRRICKTIWNFFKRFMVISQFVIFVNKNKQTWSSWLLIKNNSY